jgi:hypothetical protein
VVYIGYCVVLMLLIVASTCCCMSTYTLVKFRIFCYGIRSKEGKVIVTKSHEDEEKG